MAELPEYQKQRHTIEPAPVVQGVIEAYNTVGKSTSIIGEVGSQIAQNAANQLATVRGEEEAIRNPGRQLLPAFTEADSNFVKAFEQQAYNSAISSSNQLLQKQYANIMSEPLSSSSLELFEKNSMEGLEGIIQNVPQSIRSKLKHDFLNSYNINYFSISKQLAHKNQKELSENFNSQFNQDLRSTVEKIKLGFLDDATTTKERVLENINTAEDSRLISKAEAQSYREMAELSFKTANYVNNVDQKYKTSEKESIDYIRNFFEKPPSNLTPSEHASISKSMLDAFHRNEIMTKGSKALNALELHNAIDNGTVTEAELPLWKDKVGDEEFLKAMGRFEKQQGKLRQNRELAFNAMEAKMNGGDTTFWEDQEVKGAEEGLLKYFADGKPQGKGLDIQDYENAAIILNDPRCDFSKNVQRMALSGNPDSLQQASALIGHHDADKKNHYLDGLSKEARAIVTSYINESIANSGKLSPEEIAMKVRNDVLNVSKQDMEAREVNFKKKTSDWNDLSEIRRTLSNLTGWDKNDIPDDALTYFRNALHSEAMIYPTLQFEAAKEAAARTIMRQFNETNINGYEQIMRLPPEMFVNKSTEEINKEIIEDLKNYLPELDKKFKDKQIDKTYELIKEAEEIPGVGETLHSRAFFKPTPLSEQGIRRGNRVTKDVYGNLQKQPGRIEIISDSKTGWPQEGKEPSYMLQFVPDDTGLPEKIPARSGNIYDARRYSPVSNLANMSPEQIKELMDKLNNKEKKVNNVNFLSEMNDIQYQMFHSSPGEMPYYNRRLYTKLHNKKSKDKE